MNVRDQIGCRLSFMIYETSCHLVKMLAKSTDQVKMVLSLVSVVSAAAVCAVRQKVIELDKDSRHIDTQSSTVGRVHCVILHSGYAWKGWLPCIQIEYICFNLF